MILRMAGVYAPAAPERTHHGVFHFLTALTKAETNRVAQQPRGTARHS